MGSILDATDVDLTRFLVDRDAKLILYHGWGAAGTPPEPTLKYYTDIVTTTFDGNLDAAKDRVRLFMIPGMGHCGGGPGPNSWDKLAPLVEWVETGTAPDFIVATHVSDDVVDNERRVCAYPEQAVYAGPSGGQQDPVNWIQRNFSCR